MTEKIDDEENNTELSFLEEISRLTIEIESNYLCRETILSDINRLRNIIEKRIKIIIENK
jgi:plasmid replication initiation protein